MHPVQGSRLGRDRFFLPGQVPSEEVLPQDDGQVHLEWHRANQCKNAASSYWSDKRTLTLVVERAQDSPAQAGIKTARVTVLPAAPRGVPGL